MLRPTCTGTATGLAGSAGVGYQHLGQPAHRLHGHARHQQRVLRLAHVDGHVGGHAHQQRQRLCALQRDRHVVDHHAALQRALQRHRQHLAAEGLAGEGVEADLRRLAGRDLADGGLVHRGDDLQLVQVGDGQDRRVGA